MNVIGEPIDEKGPLGKRYSEGETGLSSCCSPHAHMEGCRTVAGPGLPLSRSAGLLTVLPSLPYDLQRSPHSLPIHREAPLFTDQSTEQEILETGIKVSMTATHDRLGSHRTLCCRLLITQLLSRGRAPWPPTWCFPAPLPNRISLASVCQHIGQFPFPLPQVVDLLPPYQRGGKIGLFGGAGVGKTVLIMELINNIAKAHGQSRPCSPHALFGEVGALVCSEACVGDQHLPVEACFSPLEQVPHAMPLGASLGAVSLCLCCRARTCAGGFSVFAGVGERTREGNDLYKEMIESGVIKLGDKQVRRAPGCALIVVKSSEGRHLWCSRRYWLVCSEDD